MRNGDAPWVNLILIKMQCGLRAVRVGAKEALDNYQGDRRRLGRNKGLRRLLSRRTVVSRASFKETLYIPIMLEPNPCIPCGKKAAYLAQGILRICVIF